MTVTTEVDSDIALLIDAYGISKVLRAVGKYCANKATEERPTNKDGAVYWHRIANQVGFYRHRK